MRKPTMIWLVVVALLASALSLPAGAQVNTEPPGVARVSLTHGEVSMQRGDSGDTSAVDLNTPLVAGDKVFTGTRSRAEIQLDWANMLRLDENAQADIATLERTRIQVQLAQGLANYSVLKGSEADVEIDTPSVAIIPLREGRYRIEVTPAGDTLVTVREGEADITTPDGSTRLKKGQLITVRGAGSDVQFQIARAPSTDDFDRWNNDRDRIIANAEGWRRTNRYYTGAGDLDAYGKWSRVPDYGYVWVPRVAVGWAPYRHGRWHWQAYYGWTWIGAEPWGWAPYHYGRWFVHRGSWVWWPGPVTPHYRPVYAPAYVSFFGFGAHSGFSVGVSFGGGFGSIGWLPAGPCDYVNPWWGRHRNNFNVVNVTNITNVTNIYNVRNVNVIRPLRGGHRESNVHNMLVNNQVRFGLSTVSAGDFGRGRANVRTVSTTELREGQFVAGNLPVVPTRDSLRASDRPVASSASSRQAQGRFFSRRVPSSQRESFSDQTAQLRQSVERAGPFRSSSGGADNATADNRPAASGGGFAGSANRSSNSPSNARNNTAELNSPRQNQSTSQAQTPAPATRREPTAGFRRFGNGQPSRPASGDSQSTQRTPVLRSPRQRAAGSESSPNGPDATADPARPARNQMRPAAPQSGLPRITSRRVPANDPENIVAQNNAGNQKSENQSQSDSNSTSERPSGWQRFSGGSRAPSPSRGTSATTNQNSNRPSPRSDTRPPLELNRPIIQPRDSGQPRTSANPRGFGGSSQTPPRATTSPNSNTRVAPAPRSAPDTASRGTATPSRGTAGTSRGAANARSAPSTGTRGRAPERPQAKSN
jgi:hypothetical protein